MKIFFLIYFSCSICIAHSAQSKTVEEPIVRFLNKTEARIAIINDQKDNYFESMYPMEMSAKTGMKMKGTKLQDMRKECKSRYQNAVLEFNEQDQNTINTLIKDIHPKLKSSYPKLAALPWSFIKIQNHIEGGMPHTRDLHIIFSERTLQQMTQFIQNKNKFAYHRFIQLLIHEQVHVLQRLEQSLFDSLYKDTWGFKKAKSIQSCKWLEIYHLSNPDGVECNWVFPIKNTNTLQYYLPLVIFNEGHSLKRMPHDFLMIMLELKEKKEHHFDLVLDQNQKPNYKNLLQVKDYTSKFPLTRNIYHPNEASAELIGKLFVFDEYTTKDVSAEKDNSKRISKLHAPLRQWCKKHLK